MLHQALYPPIYYLGTIASLDSALIPKAQQAIEVVKSWSRDLLYSRPRWDQKLLTSVYQEANLCFFLDKLNAQEYIHNAPVFRLFEEMPDYCRSLGISTCVVSELAHVLQGTDGLFISRGILFVK